MFINTNIYFKLIDSKINIFEYNFKLKITYKIMKF